MTVPSDRVKIIAEIPQKDNAELTLAADNMDMNKVTALVIAIRTFYLISMELKKSNRIFVREGDYERELKFK